MQSLRRISFKFLALIPTLTLFYVLPTLFGLNDYAIIQLMNSLSVFKLIIPAFKTINKLLQKQTEKSTEQLIKQFCSQLTFHPQVKTDQTFKIINNGDSIEPILSFPKEESEEDVNEEFQLSTSVSSYANGKCLLQKNKINHRIKSLQYDANSPCEDSLSYEQLKTINAYTISIFDGHGGPELAEYSRSKINTFIDSFIEDNLKRPYVDIGELIKQSLKWSYQKIEDTFFETYEQQLKMGNRKIRNVGTCGITAVIHNDKVYVGNAGDSQAIFVMKEGFGTFRASKACNRRLSVNSRYEREKIMKEWAGKDEAIITEQSANVYYLKGRLQPTRTIGDYYLKKEEYYFGQDSYKGPYLNCNPEIDEHIITKSHKYMIIASDGIWDALSKSQLLNILMRQKQIDLNKTLYESEQEEPPYIKNVVTKILEKASDISGRSVQDLKEMPTGCRRNYHDDITLAVINLQNQFEQ